MRFYLLTLILNRYPQISEEFKSNKIIVKEMLKITILKCFYKAKIIIKFKKQMTTVNKKLLVIYITGKELLHLLYINNY